MLSSRLHGGHGLLHGEVNVKWFYFPQRRGAGAGVGVAHQVFPTTDIVVT